MDWLNDHLWETWLGVAILLGVAEMFSLDLVLIMLAVGALAGMLAALAGLPAVATALIGAGAAVAMLSVVRPSLAKRLHGGPELSLGHGKLVGQRAMVIEEITGLQIGRIKIGGEVWSAAPYDEHLIITPGETVEVLQIKGATAFVHPVASLEN